MNKTNENSISYLFYVLFNTILLYAVYNLGIKGSDTRSEEIFYLISMLLILIGPFGTFIIIGSIIMVLLYMVLDYGCDLLRYIFNLKINI